MDWLLKLFPTFQRLSDSYRDVLAEVAALREQNAMLVREREDLWHRLDTSMENEREAYKAHVNLNWQKKGYGIPYPSAPHVDGFKEFKAPEEAGVPRRKLGSEAVAQGTANFIRDYIDSNKA